MKIKYLIISSTLCLGSLSQNMWAGDAAAAPTPGKSWAGVVATPPNPSAATPPVSHDALDVLPDARSAARKLSGGLQSNAGPVAAPAAAGAKTPNSRSQSSYLKTRQDQAAAKKAARDAAARPPAPIPAVPAVTSPEPAESGAHVPAPTSEEPASPPIPGAHAPHASPPVSPTAPSSGEVESGSTETSPVVDSPSPEPAVSDSHAHKPAAPISAESASSSAAKSPSPAPAGEADSEAVVADYHKEKAAVQTIVDDARKNPALKQKLDDAYKNLQAAAEEQKAAQVALDTANKEYSRINTLPKPGAEELQTAQKAKDKASASFEAASAALLKQKTIYEALLHQTETTKQTRVREYKTAVSLYQDLGKQLKVAETELKKLNAAMDALQKNPKSKEQDIAVSEKKIEEMQVHVDSLQKNWEQALREMTIAKLRSETILEHAQRERDRTKERLAGLQERLSSKKVKGKKDKKAQTLQELQDEIAAVQEELKDKEKTLKAAQKGKDAGDLAVEADGFDPNDPEDGQTVEEEMTTPAERAAAKKALPDIIKGYYAAKKTREDIEKTLVDTEKEYLDLKWKMLNNGSKASDSSGSNGKKTKGKAKK